MSRQQNAKTSHTLYGMLIATLLLIAATFQYLSQPSETSKDSLTLNGPWKFKIGDNIQYAQSDYDDSGWEKMDLTAPAGAHDDDVGLSGYIPGWTANGHPDYSGYAWYRLKIPLDGLREKKLAFAAPPAVDDAYQLFINGSMSGSGGADFSGPVPVVYSIRPQLFLLPEQTEKQTTITIAFRVWMSSSSVRQGSGGIHIAPTLGEKTDVEKKYRFQWGQTIKGYIVEVVLPIMFILLAISVFLVHKRGQQPQSCRWFIAALIFVGLVRLNQAVYFWFQIESRHQAIILASVILRPLMLASWLMAWREWFDLQQPKWLPKIVLLLTLLHMIAQLFGASWILNSLYTNFQAMSDYIRLALLALMLFTFYQGIRKQGVKNLSDVLVLVAMMLISIALFPKEVSELHIIPGIWFPYGVGVSRGQFFYAAFVVVMYVVLILKNRKLEFE